MAVAKRVDNKGRKLPDGFSQRPDGRYMARFTFKGERYTLYDKELNRLKEKVNEKKYNLEHDIFCKTNKITLNKWAEQWIETYYKGRVKPTTLVQKKYQYKHYVGGTVGKMFLQDIKPLHIRNLYNEMSKTLSKSVIASTNSFLNLMFAAAIENGLISSNPAYRAMNHLKFKPGEERRVLTQEEQKRFFDFIKEKEQWRKYVPMFTIAFGTGVRFGELMGLTWDNVDFEKNLILIRKQIKYEKFEGDITATFHVMTPKTVRSVRDIPMTAVVRESFLQQKEMQKRKNIPVQRVGDYDNFVFTSVNGYPYTLTVFARKINDIVKGINREETQRAREENRVPFVFDSFHPHATRHTFATRAFEAGMKPKVIQEILGHSEIDTTMNFYTHVTEKTKLDEIELLEKMNVF